MSFISEERELPLVRVVVLEAGQQPKGDQIPCVIGEDVDFKIENLQSYFLAPWKEIIFDTFLLAAAVEFCDRIKARPKQYWGREIELHLPVHDIQHWRQAQVSDALHDALNFLTGDRWKIRFSKRRKKALQPEQMPFDFPQNGVKAVIPFSDGLDSRAVAGLLEKQYGDTLIRVRLGGNRADIKGKRLPFTTVPYQVSCDGSETSGRSRGFKFALLGGIAAYLVNASEIIVPESGQGAIGPTLVPVGQAYEDYRNHPLFTCRMEKFLLALLEQKVSFRFPRIWHTKGETLSEFVTVCGDKAEWETTKSCWQSRRHVSVHRKKRQCGICAACMLRRMSVHAAGLTESKDVYVWENLSASDFEAGAAAGFDKITGALREYAIGGTMHLDHLAELSSSKMHAPLIQRAAWSLKNSIGIASQSEVDKKLQRLLKKHSEEWNAFTRDLGKKSFIEKWMNAA